MAGRAGRRGLDTVGIVIINCRNDEVPEETTLKTLLTGRATKLESKFRVTYSMILNLLRQEEFNGAFLLCYFLFCSFLLCCFLFSLLLFCLFPCGCCYSFCSANV
jgi:superfamily II RNA helicase